MGVPGRINGQHSWGWPGLQGFVGITGMGAGTHTHTQGTPPTKFFFFHQTEGAVGGL